MRKKDFHVAPSQLQPILVSADLEEIGSGHPKTKIYQEGLGGKSRWCSFHSILHVTFTSSATDRYA